MAEFTGYDEGTPCWVDLLAPDPVRAEEFYADLFGWSYQDAGPGTGGYRIATLRGLAVAGLGAAQAGGNGSSGEPGAPAWTTYLWSDDADAAAERIGAAGGLVLRAPAEVPRAGRTALAQDRTGAVFGVWQGRESRGAQLANEPGAFTWNENLNDDPAAARAFYRAAFGFKYEKFAEWETEYDLFEIDGAVRGGIGAKPPAAGPAAAGPAAPNAWHTYFSVADTDDAVAMVVKGGGAVVREARDTKVGRIAMVADPDGAPFRVISLPKPA